MALNNGDLNWITNYIWGIADDVLRDLYVRGKYRDVILPMTVLRRLDAVLEDSKQAVLAMKATLDAAGVVEQDAALRQAAGQAFYNTSRFTLRDLRARASRQQLTADFEAYLDGFSPNVQDILDNFEFRNQMPRLSRADALGTLVEKLTAPDINLSPAPVLNADGSVRHPGLDNHGMGSIFEELVRRFNEENNEEAGEHWTPRDAVRLMARLVFLPVAANIRSGTYLLYDGACGTGGMLTVAEDTLRQLAAEHGKDVSTHLYGQEINAETYAICKADLLLKGEGEAGRQHRRRPGALHPGQRRLPGPRVRLHALQPALRQELEDRPGAHGRQEGHARPALRDRARRRPGVFAGHPLQRRPDALPRQQTGQDEAPHRARQPHRRGAQRQFPVHRRRRTRREQHPPLDHRETTGWRPSSPCRSTCSTTPASPPTSGCSPTASPRTAAARCSSSTPPSGSSPCARTWAKRTSELGEADVARICDTFLAFEESEQSRIFDNAAFGYWKVTVERPLRVAGIDPNRAYKAAEIKALKESGERREDAPPVIRKIHKRGTPADPLCGLFETSLNGAPAVVEYEPDPDLRDTEQIPLQEAGGIDAFLRREVLPYAPDAWYPPDGVKIGYEISFTRYFYKPQPMRTLAEIRADILALERETEGLLDGILRPC